MPFTCTFSVHPPPKIHLFAVYHLFTFNKKTLLDNSPTTFSSKHRFIVQYVAVFWCPVLLIWLSSLHLLYSIARVGNVHPTFLRYRDSKHMDRIPEAFFNVPEMLFHLAKLIQGTTQTITLGIKEIVLWAFVVPPHLTPDTLVVIQATGVGAKNQATEKRTYIKLHLALFTSLHDQFLISLE